MTDLDLMTRVAVAIRSHWWLDRADAAMQKMRAVTGTERARWKRVAEYCVRKAN